MDSFNLNLKPKRNKIFILVFSVALGVLLGLKDLMILKLSTWPHLYAVVNISPLTFEEIYCYLPLAARFSPANLLPAAPMAYPFLSQFTFFPALTILFEGIFFKGICFSNIDTYLLVHHILFPLASFWLLVLFFRRYVAVSWSLLLAFWGVTFYTNFSSLGYLFRFLIGMVDPIKMASLTPLEITRIPSPGFTFFFFILCFTISTSRYRISWRRYIGLTILWSLNIYVYLYNFIAGILFWFGFMLFTQFLKGRSTPIKPVVKTVGMNLLVMGICIAPYLLKMFFFSSPLDSEIVGNLGLLSRSSGIIVNDWGIVFSYVLPLILTILIIRFYCGDYYELFYKFMPVFIMVLVEIVVLNLHLILGSFFQTHLFSIRIGNFFCRFLYYLPVFYFFSNPFKELFHSPTKNKIARTIHDLFNRYINRFSHVISGIGIAGIALVVIFSSVKYYVHYQGEVVPRMNRLQHEFNELVLSAGQGGAMVSEDLPVNLLIPVLSDSSSLVVNAFNNHISHQEILDRLVLLARIYQWDEEKFLQFMMPSRWFKNFYAENDFTVTDQVLREGFGYWLMWHRREMSEEELKDYQAGIMKRFRQLNIKEALDKYQVRAIQAFGPINPEVPVKQTFSRFLSKVYVVGHR